MHSQASVHLQPVCRACDTHTTTKSSKNRKKEKMTVKPNGTHTTTKTNIHISKTKNQGHAQSGSPVLVVPVDGDDLTITTGYRSLGLSCCKFSSYQN